MTQIVVSMVVIVLVAGVVAVYVAFPHRARTSRAPWLGRLMRRGARSLPTVEPEPGDVMPADGGSPERLESPIDDQARRAGRDRPRTRAGQPAPGQHRA